MKQKKLIGLYMFASAFMSAMNVYAAEAEATVQTKDYLLPFIIMIACALVFGLLSMKSSDERSKPLIYDADGDNDKFYNSVASMNNQTIEHVAPAYVPQAKKAAPISDNKIKIQCLGGLLTHQVFAADDRLVIGRDPKYCNILYNSNTPGVSSIHCEIKRNGSGFTIVDKGSKCGTYLANGTKLDISVPVSIKRGDRFYIAEPENMFVIL